MTTIAQQYDDALASAGRDATEVLAGHRALIALLSRRIPKRAAQVHETYDVEPLDVSAMLDQLQGAVEHNVVVRRSRGLLQKHREQLTAYKAEMTRLTVEIEAMTARRAQVETEHESLWWVVQRAEPVQEIDTALLRMAIEDAMVENGRKYDERLARRAYTEALSDLDRAVREGEQLSVIIAEAARMDEDDSADITPVGA